MPTNLNQPLLGPFRQGARNEGVRAIQNRLNEVLDPPSGANQLFGGLQAAVVGSRFVRLVADGAFGAKTAAAVVRFQKLRLLQADGVVGPVTAKALGFTQYTSLQRLGAGAMQLGSVITGSLARLIPAPHSDPDLAYSALVTMAVQADAMRRMLGTFGTVAGLEGIAGDLENIVAGVQQQLARAQAQRFMASAAKQALDYADSTHGRLMALSQRMHRLAKPPGTQTDFLARAFLQQQELLDRQRAIIGMMRGLSAVGMMGSSQLIDPGDDLLKLAAKLAKVAKQLPHF